ncbi:conserved Plasmodium protein, unknown function [Plasmodium ovale]|uniref:Uncharacterized protein n=2 Tax=Plasmodium ovale TaxID=36330 RepID=A0A1A8W6V3_PLAOA|nr:conserved Plasmodium protein, unknown function [Plasmodium ovale curtisi]SBS98468.1 conserved Plasmodium protein, unknown function [Plasmodium ovale curtisi]SCQ17138.1 conserved Plasmodium protein, unknown function [Plasmodium ovale]
MERVRREILSLSRGGLRLPRAAHLAFHSGAEGRVLTKKEKGKAVNVVKEMEVAARPEVTIAPGAETKVGAGMKNELLTFHDNLDALQDTQSSWSKYQIDDTFSPYIKKKKKFLNMLSYEVKKYDDSMLYKKSDGCENAYMYSTNVKSLQNSDRVSDNLYVNVFDSSDHSNRSNRGNFSGCSEVPVLRKSLFDILYKKHSILFLFTDIKHMYEIDKYVNHFEKRKNSYNLQHRIMNEDGNILLLRKRKEPINIFYCYVSPYKFLLSSYFSKKTAQHLKRNYFSKKNFFFLNTKLNVDDQNALMFYHDSRSDNSLPSLLLIDKYCYVRYHIKGLFTNEAAHYLLRALLAI